MRRVVSDLSVVSEHGADSLKKILEDYLELDPTVNSPAEQLLQPQELARYFKCVPYHKNELVFNIDQSPEQIYFIQRGEVEIVALVDRFSSSDPPSHHSALASQSGSWGKWLARQIGGEGSDGSSIDHTAPINTGESQGQEDSHLVRRVNKVSAGGVFGEADFFLDRKYSVKAFALTDCVFWILDRDGFASIETDNPRLCVLIQHMLLKSLAITNTCSVFTLRTHE